MSDCSGKCARHEELLGRLQVALHMVDELQKANTRLLEERRAVDHRYQVSEFMRAVGQPVLDKPQVPADERARLRLRLIAEEFFEALRATLVEGELSVTACGAHEECVLACAESIILTAIADDEIRVDLPELADALADLDYVVEGARLEFGINGAPIATEVHRANMAKLDGPVREDGKKQKPEGWKPPDIESELRKQGWEK